MTNHEKFFGTPEKVTEFILENGCSHYPLYGDVCIEQIDPRMVGE